MLSFWWSQDIGKNKAGFILLPLVLLIHFPFINLVLFISVRKHSTFRRRNTKTIGCLTLTYIFKYSCLIFKPVIDIKVKVSDWLENWRIWQYWAQTLSRQTQAGVECKTVPSFRTVLPSSGLVGLCDPALLLSASKAQVCIPWPSGNCFLAQSGRKARIPLLAKGTQGPASLIPEPSEQLILKILILLQRLQIVFSGQDWLSISSDKNVANWITQRLRRGKGQPTTQSNQSAKPLPKPSCENTEAGQKESNREAWPHITDSEVQRPPW